jgi:preprotein translocase subunit YajC
MLQTITTQAEMVLSRVMPTLLAMQDAKSGAPAAPAAGGGGGGGGSPLMSLALPLLMIVFFYFVIIRPANKQRKEQDALMKGLQKGDNVVTSSGIIGKISGLDEQYVTLEISERVRVKFLREAVTKKVVEKDAKDGAKKSDEGSSTGLFAKSK